MGLARYSFVVTPRSDLEGCWVDAGEAEAELEKLNHEWVLCVDEVKKGSAKLLAEKDAAHEKTVLSMQGDKDILMARIKELSEINQQIDELQYQLKEKDTQLSDRTRGMQIHVDKRDQRIAELEAQLSEFVEQLNVKDKINAELVEQRDSAQTEIQGLMQTHQKNLDVVQQKDRELIAELRQSIQMSHEAEAQLKKSIHLNMQMADSKLKACVDDQIRKHNVLQAASESRIKELENRLMAMDDLLTDERYANGKFAEELEHERTVSWCLKVLLVVGCGTVLVVELVRIFG